jgi:hypothetical protein
MYISTSTVAYTDVIYIYIWRMLTYADVCWRMQVDYIYYRLYRCDIYIYMWRMLTYADACWRMQVDYIYCRLYGCDVHLHQYIQMWYISTSIYIYRCDISTDIYIYIYIYIYKYIHIDVIYLHLLSHLLWIYQMCWCICQRPYSVPLIEGALIDL